MSLALMELFMCGGGAVVLRQRRKKSSAQVCLGLVLLKMSEGRQGPSVTGQVLLPTGTKIKFSFGSLFLGSLGFHQVRMSLILVRAIKFKKIVVPTL